MVGRKPSRFAVGNHQKQAQSSACQRRKTHSTCWPVRQKLLGVVRLISVASYNSREGALSKTRLARLSIAFALCAIVTGCAEDDGETTVYYAFCPVALQNGNCQSGEEWAGKDNYKASFSTQTVIRTGADGSPVRLSGCAVVDSENWSCRTETGGEMPDYVQSMKGGKFTSSALTSDSFYQVSAPYWWFLRILNGQDQK